MKKKNSKSGMTKDTWKFCARTSRKKCVRSAQAEIYASIKRLSTAGV